MKKLVKLLIATALIVTMAVCFAACGGKTMEKVYDLSGVKATAVATKLGYLSEFDDYYVVDAAGEWVVFGKETSAAEPKDDTRTYTLYNVATEKVAATKTVKKLALPGGGYSYPACPYSIEVLLDGEYSVGLYNDNREYTIFYGENKVDVGAIKLVPVWDEVNQTTIYTVEQNKEAGLVDVGDYIFKLVDGEVSYVKNETASISSIDEYVVDEEGNVYYYDINGSGITVYDASLNLYGYVRVPSYASAYPIVLANGNVLIQYQVAQDPYGDDYDAIEVNYNGVAKKSNYETILYNVEKNSAKEIKFDYLVSGVETENLAEKVDNIAYLYEVKESRINYNDEAMIVAKLSNNGKVGTIYGKAEDYLVNAEVEAIATNRFLAKSISGEKVLYNEEMEKLATFTGEAKANEKYIVDGEKYYNFDGVLIVDFAKYAGQYMIFSNGNAFFMENDDLNKENNYFILVDGVISKIATEYYGSEEKTSGVEVEGLGDDYYVITERTTTEKDGAKITTYVDYIYNMNGQEICKSESYEDTTNADRKPLVIVGYDVVLESEGLLVYAATVKKYNADKKDAQGNAAPAYETIVEYYYCK